MTTAIRRQYIYLPKRGNITTGSRNIHISRSSLSILSGNIRLRLSSLNNLSDNIRRRLSSRVSNILSSRTVINTLLSSPTAAVNILLKATHITISRIMAPHTADSLITATRAEKDRADVNITTISRPDAVPISRDQKRKRRRKNAAAEFQDFSQDCC